MKSFAYGALRLATSALTVVGTALAIISCGTESTPTRRTVAVTGTVKDGAGVPLAGVNIQEVTFGASATSQAKGDFKFTTQSLPNGRGELLVSGLNTAQSLEVTNIPAKAEVNVTIAFNGASKEFTIAGIDVVDLNAPTEPIPDPDPEPTTAPGAPTPAAGTPTPVPTPSGPFDDKGNTTSFGIPSGITGNVARGRAKNTSECAKCHGELGKGLSFNGLKKRISEAPMFITLPNQTLADIVAFLNRNQK